MDWLRNTGILKKILVPVALLVMTTVVVATVAVLQFWAMGEALTKLNDSGTRVFAAGRATANLLAYARNVEFLPIEMPLAEREAFEKGAVDEYRRLVSRVDEMHRSAVAAAGRADMEKARQLIARYEAEHQKIKDVSRSGDYDTAGRQAYTAAPIIGELRELFRAFEARNNSRMVEAQKEADAAQAQASSMMLIVSVLGIILSLGIAVSLVLAFVTRPLAAITEAMTRVAGGEVDVIVPSVGQKDEVGRLAGALETFKVNLIESRRLAAQQEAERAAKEQRAHVMASAVADFEKSVGEVVSTVSSASSELEAAATTLTGTAEATQHRSSMVAAASEQASGNVQAVAAATDEMTSSIHEIARQVQHSTTKANAAVADVKAADAKVTQLLEAAGRIGDVVKLVTAVAEQTNLLALNATIEAARAGEAGRGFAVVASEVKALAGQTAKATEAIGAQITAMQVATREAAASIQAIGSTIVDVSEIAAAIAAAVEEQGAATQEISRNVQEAAKGTVEVASSISLVNQGAVETGSASSQVLVASQVLSQQGSRLKSQFDTFLATVRTA